MGAFRSHADVYFVVDVLITPVVYPLFWDLDLNVFLSTGKTGVGTNALIRFDLYDANIIGSSGRCAILSTIINY
jgi:hypothetical protein